MVLDEGKPVEVLLVEDLQEDAELSIRALKKNNLVNDIKWVEDGEEALDYIFGRGEYADRNIEHKPKVILLDLKLPKVSGQEVLEKLKSDPLTKGIPVVVMTSSKEDKDIDRVYALGASSYIVKPVDFMKFAEAVAEVGHYWLLLNETPK